MDKNERMKLIGEGDISKVLTKMSIPGIVAMLVNAVYNIVDTMFVGKLGDTTALGAVSIAFPLFMLIAALGQMFGVGAGSYIARLLGGNNSKYANKVASTTFFTAIIMGVLFITAGLINIEKLLKILGATETIIPYAKIYGSILMSGSIFTILNMTMNNMIRAEGNVKYPMIAISMGAVLNCILDPIFMFGFGMGLKGAAVATVMAQSVSTIFLMSYYFSGKSFVKVNMENFKPTVTLYSEIMKIGSATLFRQVLASLSLGLLNLKAAVFGDVALASLGISSRVTMLVFYVIVGYNQGFQPVAGYNYGAGNYSRLKSAINISLVRLTVFCSIATLIFMFFSEDIVKLFSHDPEVIRVGKYTLRAMSFLLPTLGFQQLYAYLFQSLGMGKEAIVLSCARQGIFLIPACFVLPAIFGFNGVVFSQGAADIMTVLITIFFAMKISRYLKDKTMKFENASVGLSS